MSILNSPLALDITRTIKDTSADYLKTQLHSLYPEEFEYYLFTLELVNESGRILDTLVFPVMPNAISENRVSLVNIKKTNSAIVSLTNYTYAPSVITINGTFGKKIRILAGRNNELGAAFSFSSDNANRLFKEEELNFSVKTGYGVTKLLEKIIKKSQADGRNLLFLYNYALGNNYLVECEDMSFSQSTENNMLWNYQITFKAIANADDVYPTGISGLKKSMKQQLKYSVMNNAMFKLKETLTHLVNTSTNVAVDKILR